jgi:hypothetical protein
MEGMQPLHERHAGRIACSGKQRDTLRPATDNELVLLFRTCSRVCERRTGDSWPQPTAALLILSSKTSLAWKLIWSWIMGTTRTMWSPARALCWPLNLLADMSTAASEG